MAASEIPLTLDPGILHRPLRDQFEAFLDEHRAGIRACLDGLSEERARKSLVPSKTTLLGLVKHAAFVERVLINHPLLPLSARAGDKQALVHRCCTVTSIEPGASGSARLART
jgi:hypothetical protein